MNIAQKIIIIFTLLTIVSVSLYPPVEKISIMSELRLVLPEGRKILFSLNSTSTLTKPISIIEYYRINVVTLLTEVLVVVCFGVSFVVLFGLRKKSSQILTKNKLK